jgi:hypothetical protein
MKAYKCPKCGYLHPIRYTSLRRIKCVAKCGYNVNIHGRMERVEIIDWEEELLTKTE